MSQCEFWRVWAFGDVDVAENSPSYMAKHVYLGNEALPWLGGPKQLLMRILLFGVAELAVSSGTRCVVQQAGYLKTVFEKFLTKHM